MTDITLAPAVLSHAFASSLPVDVGAVLGALRSVTSSAQPAVVFTSLARVCVPKLSDECHIYLQEDGGAAYRISWPPVAEGFARFGSAHETNAGAVTTVIGSGATAEHPGYHGLVAHCWHPHRQPGPDGAALAQAAVDRAENLIREQRSSDQVSDLQNKVANLEVGMATNREIGAALGILMATRHISEPAAFDLLRTASQHGHRKLREIASDVVFTGVLD